MIQEIPLVEMKNITKAFPGAIAIDNVDFELLPGEIHVLVGQNGAGKSTLVNILAGTIKLDAGTIKVNGELVKFNNPSDAQKQGISLVPQEIPIFPDLTIAENIFMGVLPSKYKNKIFNIVDFKNLYKKAELALSKFNMHLNVNQLAGKLPIANQQLIIIAKALVRETRILIMDEPTACLGSKEIDILFDILKKLCAEEKIGIIYICHRLEEAKRVGHRITVLRDSRKTDTYDAKTVSTTTLIEAMTGKERVFKNFEKLKVTGEKGIDIYNLNHHRYLEEISFNISKGEIVGIGGVLGSGRSELLKIIYGIFPLDSGEIKIFGRKYVPSSPIEAIRFEIGYLPSDRNIEGLHLLQDVAFNISLPSLSQLISKINIVDRKKEKKETNEVVQRLQIKTRSNKSPVWTLSGGNRQKVSVAKWIFAKSKIILCDEPTRGVDVAAKDEIYQLIRELASRGITFLISSPDVEELLKVCDRIILMKMKKIIVDFESKDLSEKEILNLIL
jgi:ribose transport system ATP-binding protein